MIGDIKTTAHYTPSHMAAEIVRKTLDPVVASMDAADYHTIRVCDPACGNGVFLIEAIRYLLDLMPLRESVECVYGADIDSSGIIHASQNMVNEFGSCSNLRCAESLLEFDWSQWPKFDAVIGNPPFLGGHKISGMFGTEYLKNLKRKYPGSGGTTDLSAYFFRLAYNITKTDATIGFIATNTIYQGDTRATGLQWLVNNGCTIYDATRSRPWPGAAAVTVAVVHLAKGVPVRVVENAKTLDGHPVDAINSRLRGKPERSDPKRLGSNESKGFGGPKIYGQGFLLSPEEREELIAVDRKNGERIFPYIGGKEVNTSPTQDFHRYVINFGQMSLEEASKWPDLIRIIREKVKPERDKLRNTPDGRRLKQGWWQFCRTRPELYQAIQDLPRCLVTARVTKHLCFSFQPTDRVLNERIYVFPFDDYAHFALLQSRIHEAWTWLLSSTMKTDLNYSATDCFENFPFPEASRLSERSGVERVGRRVYEARARFMVETDQGLTKTYNALKNPECRDPRVERLRELHWEMDREVLAAYGWEDISVPAYGTPTTAKDEEALRGFSEEVIDRLFVLNGDLT